MLDLPNGTVTLLFTDVEGSTRLLRRLGERYGSALEDQRRIVSDAVVAAGGREIDSRGDELFAAFPRARAAAAAAVAVQRALAAHEWPDGEEVKVRMGLHTGEPALRDDGYLGIDVHRAARISAAAHGGQVLVSQVTHDLLAGDDVRFRDVGEHQLKDLPAPERLFQLVIDGLPSEFPPPKVAASTAPAAGRERELAAALVSAPRRMLERIRPQPRGLADLGWEVRATLATVPDEARDALSRLARDLFDASRAAAEADHALAVVDRKALVRHLADNRAQAVLSKASAREVESTARRLDALDALTARRADAEALAKDIRAQLRMQTSCADVDALRERSRAVTEDLDAALEVARRELNAVSAKLRRTRHAGVFRIGEHFVVPYFDEVGVESRREFDSVGAAVAFHRAERIGERGELGDKESERLRGEYLGSFARNAGQELGVLPPRSGRDR